MKKNGRGKLKLPLQRYREDSRANRSESENKQELKKMFGARLRISSIRKIRVWAGLTDKTKEDILQEAVDRYFKDKNVPT